MYILHRKVESHGYTTTFHIRANKHQNRKRTFTIGIDGSGTCCWRIHSRHGHTQEFEPGDRNTPEIAFISKIESKKCGEK